jgi:uncharacterized protein YjbI with pentapeptide repeats
MVEEEAKPRRRAQRRRRRVAAPAAPADPLPLLARAPPSLADEFAAKGTNLETLRAAVVDAAGVGSGLWFSYLFVLLYLLVAAGSVTHRDLLLETTIKLPFLGIELPLVGFFAIGPLLFLIAHAYVLLHFVLLAGKIGVFHDQLLAQIDYEEVRARLRRQLPSNIFVQILAGPAEVRSGFVGFMLRLIAYVSLVVGPLALLIFFLLQFLPYHHGWLTWWHRFAVLADLALLWMLWPPIIRGRAGRIGRPEFRRPRVAMAGVGSFIALLVAFTIATYPGEPLHERLPPVRWIPMWKADGADTSWLDSIKRTSLHELLVAGDIDFVARKPTSLWSNRLVLPGFDPADASKPGTPEKIATVRETLSLRGRALEGAVFIDAQMTKVDFSAASMRGALFSGADLREAVFGCASDHCADLREARLDFARLQGARLAGARLQGASFVSARLDGADLSNAELDGASFLWASLRGTLLKGALLRGAELKYAQLQAADLDRAQLQGAALDFAWLEGAWGRATQLHGATLKSADFSSVALEGAFVWRADPRQVDDASSIRLVGLKVGAQYRSLDCIGLICPWADSSFATLKKAIADGVPPGERRDQVLGRIAVLDPSKPNPNDPEIVKAWEDLASRASSDNDPETALATNVENVGCDLDGAPYVIRGLIRVLETAGSSRFGDRSPHPARLAAVFLDPIRCPGARELTEADKDRLRQVRRLRSVPAPAKAPFLE